MHQAATAAVVLTAALLAGLCGAAPQACGARCGVSWDDANSTCQAPCSTETGEQCPPGLFCWSGVSSAPCDGHREEVCGTRCGVTWDDANSKCLATCSSDPKEQCPEGLFCWSGLSNLPCESGSPNATTANAPQAKPPAVAAAPTGKGRTLVVYVVVDTDPEYWNNFLHFAREGMKPGPKETAAETQYVIAVQSDDPLRLDVSELPTLPSNAAFVFPTAGCSSWGAYGWVLKSGQVDVNEFSYFIFITSSVRGPFMPVYTQGVLDWKRALLDALDSDTKLVGSTIACDGLRSSSQATATNPYVQSYAVATDWVGLDILRKRESVFECDFPHSAAAAQTEVMASRLILDAGFNIASLMARYQGIDWRDKNKWGCNRGRDPTQRYLYDGVNVNMFEVVFVKYRHSDKFLKEPHALKAAQMELAHVAIKGAKHLLDAADLRNSHDTAARQVCFSQMWGAKGCFDAEKVRASREEYAELSDREAWARYVALDQFADSGANFECTQHPDPKPLVYDTTATKRVL